MQDLQYHAFQVRETRDGKYAGSVETLDTASLPPGEVTIRVHYSSLNYKDALSATGNKGVTRSYPHTPGIDAAGIVMASESEAIKVGDAVIVTSFDLGMNTAGGFGQYIRVPADWVVPLPMGLTLEESMILGTAGFTAAMCLEKITAQVAPDQGPVLVTGATGGVASLACAMLIKLGYEVAGVSGKPDPAFLAGLGVSQVIPRDEFLADSAPPMLKAQWAGVVDTVGGEILTTAIKSARPWAAVTCCGLVASPTLSLTVFPFILRGLSLYGIDSQHYPSVPRRALWERLAGEWKPPALEEMVTRIRLADLDHAVSEILAGRLKGRTLVDLR